MKDNYKIELEELKRKKSYLIDEDTYYNSLKNDKEIEEINKRINEIEKLI